MTTHAQAGTMLHLAAPPRNDNSHNTMPDLTAGHRGLLRSLASGAALSPSTTWVPPSDRLIFHLDLRLLPDQGYVTSFNSDSTKSGQHHSSTRRDNSRALP